jgi:hypothetical protein
MLAIIVMTISVFISFMFFIIMFIVYFDYMLSIVGLSSCSCISSYSAHSKDPWVGGQHCVSMVLIHCLPMDTPYILGHVVVCRCDTPIESFVVHSPNIGASRMRLQRKNKLCS